MSDDDTRDAAAAYFKEADVTINQTRLGPGAVMTLRVAVGSFLMGLQADGLGEDEVGRQLCAGYTAQCHALLDELHS